MSPQIIFSDVDGTLLNSDHKVLPGTLYAIRELQDKCVPFVIISGRSPSGIRPILQENGFTCPMICYSGALILDEDEKILYSEGFSRDMAQKMIQFIESNHLDCTWNIYSQDTWIVKDCADQRVKREESIVHARATEGAASDLPPDAKVGKLLCMCNPDKIIEIEHLLKETFPSMSIARSSDMLLEIMKEGVSKRTGVLTMCRLLNISVENAVAFGDHYNDIEMLETVGCPYLMGNAPEELKDRFSNITAGNDDEGIYQALVRTGIICETGGIPIVLHDGSCRLLPTDKNRQGGRL